MDNTPAVSITSEPCLNCGTPLTGDYCSNCGQQAKEVRRPFFKLTNEAVQSLFELDGRAFRSLYYLLIKPAHLTREYFSGRRTRYTAPLRLFLVISVSFFLLVSFYTAIRSMEGILNANGEVSAVEVDSADEDGLNFSIESDVDGIEDDDNGLADILSFVETINLPFFDEQTNANLRSAMSTQAESNLNALLENPNGFLRGYLEYITFFILLMIPLLALIQKIIYIWQGHFYVEHLVLTLHNHAFIILALFLGSLLDFVVESQMLFISTLFDYIGDALTIWMLIYLFLSLKNYFQQGYGITLLKFLTTSILYGFVLSLGVFVFAGTLFFLA